MCPSIIFKVSSITSDYSFAITSSSDHSWEGVSIFILKTQGSQVWWYTPKRPRQVASRVHLGYIARSCSPFPPSQKKEARRLDWVYVIIPDNSRL
jgi:hypothetical protein